jgi:hypothetical protein
MLVMGVAWLRSSDGSKREVAVKNFGQQMIDEASRDFWPKLAETTKVVDELFLLSTHKPWSSIRSRATKIRSR